MSTIRVSSSDALKRKQGVDAYTSHPVLKHRKIDEKADDPITSRVSSLGSESNANSQLTDLANGVHDMPYMDILAILKDKVSDTLRTATLSLQDINSNTNNFHFSS